jgi:nicotinamidase-related amidase
MTEHEKVLQAIAIKDSAPLAVEAARCALLVVDAQRDFVEPGHAWSEVLEKLVPGVSAGYFERAQRSVVPNIQRLLQWFRASGLPIAYTGTGTCTSDGSDLAGWLRAFDQLGQMILNKPVWPATSDKSWEIHPDVGPRAGELVLNKTSSSACNNTDLERWLRQRGVETVIVTGFTSDVCVSTSARDLADRGFQIIIAEDACTTLSDEMHRASMLQLGIAFARVRRTEDVLALLTRVEGNAIPSAAKAVTVSR